LKIKYKRGGFTSYIEKEVCKKLARFAVPHKLPHTNTWNIDVQYSQGVPGLIRFTFITSEDMRIDYEFDMRKLKDHGQEYMENGINNLTIAINDFKKARLDKGPEIILPI